MGPEDKPDEKLGSLYSLSGKSIRKHMCSIGISNGIAFSLCGCWMYYIDTTFPGIYKFKFDEKEGDIGITPTKLHKVSNLSHILCTQPTEKCALNLRKMKYPDSLMAWRLMKKATSGLHASSEARSFK